MDISKVRIMVRTVAKNNGSVPIFWQLLTQVVLSIDTGDVFHYTPPEDFFQTPEMAIPGGVQRVRV